MRKTYLPSILKCNGCGKESDPFEMHMFTSPPNFFAICCDCAKKGMKLNLDGTITHKKEAQGE